MPLTHNLLLSLGLACAPAPVGPTEDERQRDRDAPLETADTADTAQTSQTGLPCLDTVPREETGLVVGPCLCTCDNSSRAGLWLLPGLAWVARVRRRREVLEALESAGVLPDDVVDRIDGQLE